MRDAPNVELKCQNIS